MKRKSLLVMVLLLFAAATAAWAGWHSEIREMLFKGTVIFEKGVTFNQAPTFVTGFTSTTAPTYSALTASKPVFTDSNKALTSSGTMPVNQGGTNLTSYAVGDILYASGATTIGKLADVAAGQPLLSGGVATAPAYAGYTLSGTAAQTYTFPSTSATLARTDAANTFAGTQTFSALTASKPVFTDSSKVLTSSGTLGVDQGGTNLTSYTAGDLLYASGATTLSKLAKGTAYQTLQMNSGATAPAWASGETLLSATTISLGADGNTTIFTVPAGRTAVLTRAYLVAAADAGTSTLTIGQAGALTDFLGTQTLSAIDAEGDVGFLSPIPNATTPKIEAYAAGTVIKAVVGSHAGSAGNTLYLFGFLY